VPTELPAFTARPRTPDLPSDPYEVRTGIPDFDSAYRLQAVDPFAVCAVLRPPLTARLLEVAGLPVAGFGRWVATWRPGRTDAESAAAAVSTGLWLAGEITRLAQQAG
jgi:hypothetical protein